MLFGVAGFELRYQLRNPVFWVAVAIFFLLSFALTASENVQIGGGGAIHENAPFGIALALGLFCLFYQFVTTSFVANAIIRDEATGFAPIVRATSVIKTDFVLGRFLGGLGIALLGYLAVRLRTEIMQVLKSPGLIVILLLAVFNAVGELWTTRTMYGTQGRCDLRRAAAHQSFRTGNRSRDAGDARNRWGSVQ